MRFIAEYKAKQQWSLLRGILRRSTQTVLAFSILVGVIVAVITLFLKKRLGSEQVITFYIASVLLPVFALCQLQEAALRALKCVVQSELLLRFIRPVLLALIVAGPFFWTKNSLSAANVMAGNIVAAVGVFLIGTVLLRKALPEPASQAKLAYAQKQWLKVSLPLLLIAGMHIILKRTDIIMIGAIWGPDDAGVYSAASRISDLVVFGLIAVEIREPLIVKVVEQSDNTPSSRVLSELLCEISHDGFYGQGVFNQPLVLIVFGQKFKRLLTR